MRGEIVDRIIKEIFSPEAPLTDEEIRDLATNPRWIDKDFIDDRRKFLERLQKRGFSRSIAEMALEHADEYTKGISEVMTEKAPELLEETIRTIYPEALKISEAWATEYVERMFF